MKLKPENTAVRKELTKAVKASPPVKKGNDHG